MALSTTQYGYIIDPMVPFTDDKGKTIKNGFVRVFVAGSSTPVITYRNFDGATNQDLIELDNSGRTKTSVIGSKGFTYKVCVYDKHHSQESPILTVDKVSVIGANITAGAGATVVTGLDGLTTKPDGFVDASVVGTDGYVALDHTLVEDDLDTAAKATAVENDRYIPLLNEDVNDPDSKMTLGRLWQWVLGKIKSLPTTITAFRQGDVIPVDGPQGTAKMSKDNLLKETAENALSGNAAPAFDESQDYVIGQNVMYNGTLYVFTQNHSSGAWNSAHARPSTTFWSSLDGDYVCGTWKEKTYIDASGNEVSVNLELSVFYLDIEEGEIFFTDAVSSTNGRLAFYDEDGVVIGTPEKYDEIGIKAFVAPTGAKLCKITNWARSDQQYFCLRPHVWKKNGTDESIDKVMNAVISVKDKFSELFGVKWVGRRYVKSDGTIGTYTTDELSVAEISGWPDNVKTIYTNAVSSPAGYYAFYNSSGVVVGTPAKYDENGLKAFNIPANAVLLRVTNWARTDQQYYETDPRIYYDYASIENIKNNVSEIESLNERVSKVYHVEKDGSGDFTSLMDCIRALAAEINPVVYVGDGVWDIVEELGDDFFVNFAGRSNNVVINNGIHLIFSSRSLVTCHYTGNNVQVLQKFSPFNTIDGNPNIGVTIEGLNLECSRVRYCIHDDTGEYSTNPYKNVFKNCRLKIDNTNNGSWTSRACIGGGFGQSSTIEVDNCYLESVATIGRPSERVLSYHNCNGSVGKSRLFVRNVFVAGTTDYMRVSYFGNSTDISHAYFSACSTPKEIVVEQEAAGYSTVNVDLTKWQNEIRNP